MWTIIAGGHHWNFLSNLSSPWWFSFMPFQSLPQLRNLSLVITDINGHLDFLVMVFLIRYLFLWYLWTISTYWPHYFMTSFFAFSKILGQESKCEWTQKLNLGTSPGAVFTSTCQRTKLHENALSFQNLKIQKTKQRMMSR